MNIALVTTFTSGVENDRIRQEIEKIGHAFKLIDLKNFSFSSLEGKAQIPGLTGLKADLVIVRGILNSIKPISVMLNHLRKEGIKVFDNNFVEHKYSIDKVADLIKLSLAGIPIPRTSYLRDFKSYSKVAEKIGYPFIIKSVRAGKGEGVYKVDGKNELEVFIKKRQEQGKSAKSYIIQEFIPYVYDLRALIIGESVFCMRRIPQKGEFRANFSLGGSVEPFELDVAGKKLAVSALAAVGMSVGGVDILITEDGKRYILEVNHSAGFAGMEKATGKNIARVYVEWAISNAK